MTHSGVRPLIISDYSRSGLKAVTWRVIATSTTMFLVFVFTGKLELTVGVGFFDVVMKLAFYFLHERAWNMVGFGRAVQVDDRLLSVFNGLSDIEAL